MNDSLAHTWTWTLKTWELNHNQGEDQRFWCVWVWNYLDSRITYTPYSYSSISRLDVPLLKMCPIKKKKTTTTLKVSTTDFIMCYFNFIQPLLTEFGWLNQNTFYISHSILWRIAYIIKQTILFNTQTYGIQSLVLNYIVTPDRYKVDMEIMINGCGGWRWSSGKTKKQETAGFCDKCTHF